MPHGALLNEFTEAVLEHDEARMARARADILAAMGPAALVDACGAVASFNAVVKVADGSGVVIEDFKKDAADEVVQELGVALTPKKKT